MKFALALHTDDGVHYGVTVPDLPGCFSAGDTLDEAMSNGKEAIAFHLETLTEDGAALPRTQAVHIHQANATYAGAVWAIVDINTRRFEGVAEKINITLPKRLISQIDDYTKTRGATRSGFLAQAAREMMQH